jgi:uncharacterized protein
MIPAVVLSEIEKKTGKRIAEMFDFIAGTSTGGILALALTVPGPDGQPKYSAAELIELYSKEGPRIFSRDMWHRVRALGNLMEEKYPATGLVEVLQSYFGETRLKDALKPVLVTSYEIEQRIPWFFRSSKAKADPEYDFPMWQVARSTSAAPTYFEPEQILTPDARTGYYALIDGGVYANNPAMCAYVDMRCADPDCEIVLASLGTGELLRPYSYHEAKGWGLAKWAQPLLNIIFDGASKTVDFQLSQLLPMIDNQQCYYRLQTELTRASDDMDDATAKNLRLLKLQGEELIRKSAATIDSLCAQL